MSFIEQPPLLYRLIFPEAVWRIKRRDGPAVYITFDDGPIPEITPQVLDILDRFGVKATFFMVGDNVRRNPQLLDEVLRRGHAVGNHTMHHLQGVHTTWRTYARDVAEADALICSRLFRPPHGILRPAQMRAINARYNVVMYDVVTRDYSRQLTADDVFKNVVRYARDGSIIVFHDSLKAAPRVLDALPRALEWLKAQGYAFHTIPEPGAD